MTDKEKIEILLGKIDALVNNIGIYPANIYINGALVKRTEKQNGYNEAISEFTEKLQEIILSISGENYNETFICFYCQGRGFYKTFSEYENQMSDDSEFNRKL